MMDCPLKVFVVDDEPLARAVALDALRDAGYQLREFGSGGELLAAADAAPDIILLDVEMPDMGGVAVCQAWRAAVGDGTQVLFVSAHDDLETRLNAYHAGGNDYIVKPYSPQGLTERLRLAEQSLTRQRELAAQMQHARQAAFTAMSSMSEMGAVLQFLRASFACQDSAQLSRALFDALGQYGLSGLVEIRVAPVCQSFSIHGECTQLEYSILCHLRNADRILQLRDRLAINYPRVTLIVMNLPIDDPERVGRLRDHLAILVEGAQARAEAMDGEARRLAQTDGIGNVLAQLGHTLAEIERHQANGRVQAMDVSAEYLRDLTNAFVHLGLGEGQESALADMAQRAHARLDALIDEGQFVGDRLREVASQLHKLVGDKT